MILWITDPHLDYFHSDREITRWGVSLQETYHPEYVVISGDISQSIGLKKHLSLLQKALKASIWFVPGNHDYWGSDIATVDAICSSLGKKIQCLDSLDYVQLEGMTLVGQFAWYDGRAGKGRTSGVQLWDFRRVKDLAAEYQSPWMWQHMEDSRTPLLSRLQTLAWAATQKLEAKICKALQVSQDIVVVTHVPPYLEAAWYRGQLSGEEYAPWFSCPTMGEMLSRVAANNPEARFAVLCGHTHHHGIYSPHPNLHVYTGLGREPLPVVSGPITHDLFDRKAPWER